MTNIPLLFDFAMPHITGHSVKVPGVNVKVGIPNNTSTNFAMVNPTPSPSIEWGRITPQLAMVDTGADICCIDTSKFNLSALTPAGSATSTATTQAHAATVYSIDFLIVGHATKLNLLFVGKPFSKSLTHRIILGMDFIRLGRLIIERGGNSGSIDLSNQHQTCHFGKRPRLNK